MRRLNAKQKCNFGKRCKKYGDTADYINCAVVSLLLNAHDHGKPKEGYNSFWLALISAEASI